MSATAPPPGSPADADAVGARVVVRRREADGRASDVLGILERAGAQGVAVRRADGTLVEVTARDVVAARVVPPAGLTRRAVRELEDAAARGWPGLQQERLGGWLLRAGRGATSRANSAVPLADPGRPLPDAVAAVEAWYAARGLPPRIAVPDRLAERLDDLLAARGWSRGGATVVLVRDLRADPPAVPADAGPDLHLSPTPDPTWVRQFRRHGEPAPPGFLDEVRAGEQVAFGAVAGAVGRRSLATDPGGTRWAGLSCVHVAPEVRRAGAGRGLVEGLLADALARGAERAYAQVEVANAGARAFWGRLGFAEHHRSAYRTGAGG